METSIIIKDVATSLAIKPSQVETVIDLLSDNQTIPFIARYRKEKTEGLDENQIFEISTVYEYAKNLVQRKEDVIRLIDEKGLLTPELKQSILKAERLVDVENIYQPFKEGKKTKAAIAKEYGLEPLAKLLLSNPNLNVETEAINYLNENVETVEKAIEYALDIIAFDATANPKVRTTLSERINDQAILNTSEKKKHDDEKGIFKNYYDYTEKFTKIANHRLLGINRGVNKKVITMKIEQNDQANINYIYNSLKIKDGLNKELILKGIEDGYKRLLLPSIHRAMYSEKLEVASDDAIELFAKNLEQLLLQPPLKNKVILGFDPGLRTGCKIAVIDQGGNLLHVDIIYPFFKNGFNETEGSKLAKMIKDYKVEVVAIGNGTASRESEQFVAQVIEKYKLDTSFAIISEIGASVYSASKTAQEEFPDLTVEKRSAISIARRLLDPLSELIKIDAKSIGVGQYQHDVNQKSLEKKLDFTVEKIVNDVGVDLNTASPYLLAHISGLSKTIGKNIMQYRLDNGPFNSRVQLKKVAKLGPKAFEQSAGFLRIVDGKNILDKTTIHPESYEVTKELLKHLNLDLTQLNDESFKEKISNVDVNNISLQLGSDKYTIEGILNALKHPNLDIREKLEKVQLKKSVMSIDDLEVGMKLQGVVRNVVDFGAFVDVGLKNDGLVHLSQISNSYIKHPSEKVSVNDIVDVTVIKIDPKSSKISLSMKK
ncbi:helix-hairpin-helix domain-containing protein [Mycoplasma sp. P36-A1]|uniref:helix-hairpin-helix domain-containing protein n=1 Tax=Mycoplasma sp. P36-A1 TaxID=3252900 RepID=UPI003C2D5D7D